MKHTAKSLVDSPNPQMLEMRILANHSGDERFAFLRGRYARTWDSMKAAGKRAKLFDPNRKAREEKAVGALLGDYDSSDDEEDDEVVEADANNEGGGIPPPPEAGTIPGPPPDEPPPSPPPAASALSEPRDTKEEVTGSKTTGEEGEEEKRRLRRERAEEWKRKRAEALGRDA